MEITFIPSNRVQNAFIVLFAVIVSIDLAGACYRQSRDMTIRKPEYSDYPLTHYVCVDNTTIYSRSLSTDASRDPVFERDCCGCRVSSVYQREITLQKDGWPRVQDKFYFTDILKCQCIPCTFDTHPHLLHLVKLKH